MLGQARLGQVLVQSLHTLMMWATFGELSIVLLWIGASSVEVWRWRCTHVRMLDVTTLVTHSLSEIQQLTTLLYL